MKLAIPPQIHWISSCALLLNKAFVTVGSYSAHHAQVGGIRIVKQRAYSRHYILLKKKCTNYETSMRARSEHSQPPHTRTLKHGRVFLGANAPL